MRCRLWIMCIILWITPWFGVAANKPLLDIQTWTTKAGIPVYFIAAPSIPMLDVDVVFAAGSQYDGKRFGLANMTAAMMSEGTKAWSADQLADRFDASGGQFNGQVNRDFSCMALRSLTKPAYWQANFDTFLAVLSQPTFKAHDIDRVKKQLLTALQYRQQNPSSVAKDLFYSNLYGNGPYGHAVLGNAKTVSALSQQQLQQFYQRYYVAENAAIAMVGDASPKQAKSIAERISQALAHGKAAPRHAQAKQLTHAATKHHAFTAKQSTVLVGQLGVKPGQKNKAALNVGNFILGNPGLVSELAHALREQRGWVYGVSSGFKPLQLKGPFVVSLQTKAALTEPALKLTKKIVTHAVTKGPTEEQVKQAKRAIIGAFPLAMSSNAQLSALLTGMAFYRMPLDYYDQYLAALKRVSAADVRHAWQQTINPKHFLTVIVGPESHHGHRQ